MIRRRGSIMNEVYISFLSTSTLCVYKSKRQEGLMLTLSALPPATSLKSHRASFTRLITTARWLGTNGLRFLLQWWFARTPMYWIPKGWVPYYVAWLLSFPRAPVGAVSIQIWGTACATVVQMVGAAAVSGWVLLQEQGGKGRGRGEKVAMGAEGRTGEGGEGRGEKKEL